MKTITTSSHPHHFHGMSAPNGRVWLLSALVLLAIAAAVVAAFRFRPQRQGGADASEVAVPGEHPQSIGQPFGEKSPPPAEPQAVADTSAVPDNHQPPADEDAPGDSKSISPEQARLRANYVYPTPGQARLEGSGKILTFHIPPEGQHVSFFAEGKRYECYHDGTYKIIERKPIFEDKFEEQLIALATPGATFLPSVLLNHTEEELKAMLARDVVINADDDEQTVEKKEAVAEMKKMLSDYLADGGDYIDFVTEMHKVSVEERNLHNLGMGKLYDIIDDGNDVEKARKFLAAYNETLAERGFAPLRLPRRLRKMLESGDGKTTDARP